MNAEKAYDWLLEHFRKKARLESIKHLLGWDQRTGLPKGGNAHRAEQLATMAGLIYRLGIDPRIGEMLQMVEGSHLTLDPLYDEAVNIREWRRTYDRARKIPEQLVIDLTKAASRGELAWQEARPQNDWNTFLPYLERIIELKRTRAALLAPGTEIYDGLIEDFEPGENAKRIESVFAKLSKALVELLHRIGESAKKPDPQFLRGDAPILVQSAFIRHIAEEIGYDLDSGRIDRSAHPFTSAIGPGDVRITTRFDENHFTSALFSAIHETGHALYSQGLPSEHWGDPRGSAVSMAIHESQSLMWENMVGRSAGFWKHFYPAAQKRFHWLERVAFQDFHFAINEVSPGLIRTEADEVTYNLHVILRFELERALIGGGLEARDLPHAWNDKMREYLGLTPPDFSNGVMQDVHWSSGAIGYFPSYALGTIYAAQFYDKASRDLGDPEQLFESGDFETFRGWFRTKVHSQGSRHLPRDLVRAATGEELNPDYLIGYLNRKYGKLYRIG